MANIRKAKPEGEYRHHTSIGDNGQTLFDAPIEIRNQQDLNNFGITWDDCKTLNFHGSEKITVYFYKTENRAFAEYQWSYLDSQHSRGFASTRCMIPGQRKAYIRCPDTNSCARCKYRDVKHSPVISLDSLIESGYEPAGTTPVDEQVGAKLEYQDIRAMMDSEDVRIAQAFELKELYGMKVKEIAKELKVSSPRVYQFLNRAKTIGLRYKEKKH